MGEKDEGLHEIFIRIDYKKRTKLRYTELLYFEFLLFVSCSLDLVCKCIKNAWLQLDFILRDQKSEWLGKFVY